MKTLFTLTFFLALSIGFSTAQDNNDDADIPAIPYLTLEDAEADAENARLLYLIGLGLKEMPETITKLTALEELWVNGSPGMNWSDCFAKLGKLEKLHTLHLGSNRISKLPDNLEDLKQLKSIDLSDNTAWNSKDDRSEQGLDLQFVFRQLSAVSDLQKLGLAENEISEIPEDLFMLTTLRELDLSNNLLKSLSPSVSNLKKLEVLNISGLSFNKPEEELKKLKEIPALHTVILSDAYSTEKQEELRGILPEAELVFEP